MKSKNLNLGNSIFKGFNDQDGLMICGYEWGMSKQDQKDSQDNNLVEPEIDIEHTFANKARYWGERANTWRYDNNIKQWFELWGFPLDSNELGGNFEKSLVQTNWADTQGHSIHDSDADKYIMPEHVDNFIYHVNALRPKVILLMGSKLIDYLQNPAVLPKFIEVMGDITERRTVIQKPSSGTKFRVHFQSFEHCKVVGLPHPSGSFGISYDYIASFKPELSAILTEYKNLRNF
ncbi:MULTISPECIES: hypothetical protein [Psychrobacter]|uniref:hypothetical protein n=1 Tax=Psychrobacter TaxID=497 RepID=UPI00146A620A|nr:MULTISPECIES: hypothetical protein [Psychrobacter]